MYTKYTTKKLLRVIYILILSAVFISFFLHIYLKYITSLVDEDVELYIS